MKLSLQDILIHKGDLSKNRFFRENPNNIYKDDEEMVEGEKQTINDRLTIEKELIDNIYKYI